jgi:site-specific DNA-methyltransferase (adenine-specific)
MGREEDFTVINQSLQSFKGVTGSGWAAYLADSLELLKAIPDHSISLILTDPPYHVTKKKNIYGDASFKEDQHFVDWMMLYAHEWNRILKPNGSFFCFCAPKMAGQLEVSFSKIFNVLSHITWTKPNDPGFDGWKQKMKKESLRQWYDHSERIIFAEPAYYGNLHRSYFGNLLRGWRKTAGLSGHKLTELTGAYGKVNHGGAVSNWEAGRNTPSREQYRKLVEALKSTGKIEELQAYEDVIRPFIVNPKKEFTDVWTFPNVRPYKGKHPAEKPIELLEHAIQATTFEGDIVLDCFSGSGNTALAAINLNRRAIAIDIEEQWFDRSVKRLLQRAITSHAVSDAQVSFVEDSPIETAEVQLSLG